MAIDRINFGVVRMASGVDFANPENTLQSVGMSELKSYFGSAYDTEVPHDVKMRAAMEQVFETGTALSTDQFLAEPRLENLPHYLPHFLRLALPMIEATDKLGGIVGRHIGALEDENIVLSKAAVDDMTYSGGVFDLMTIMATSELGIVHPRTQSQDANRALQQTVQESHAIATPSSSPIKDLLKTPLATLEHRQTIYQLRRTARQLAIDAEVNLVRMQHVAESFASQG